MKAIIYLILAIIIGYASVKADKVYKKEIIKQALDEHEKKKANDKSRE